MEKEVEEEKCLRACELEWILIKEPDSWSGSALVINKCTVYLW